MDVQNISREHIEYLEKRFHDELKGRIVTSSLNVSTLGDAPFVKISALSNFWDAHGKDVRVLRIFMEDIVSGFSEGAVPLIFMINGKPDEIEISAGTWSSGDRAAAENLETIKTGLKGSFHGLNLEDLPPGYLKEQIASFECSGIITGKPVDKLGADNRSVEQIERMIRGLYGRRWGYVVVAQPATGGDANDYFDSVLNEMRIVINFEKSSGFESPIGERYKELLRKYIEQLQMAKVQGMWHTAVYLYSGDRETLNHLKAISKSAIGGRESLPEQIRTFECNEKIENPGLILNPPPASPGRFAYPYSYMNTVNSSELTGFFHLPGQEMPGFQITPYARFNVSTRKVAGKAIRVGEILDQGSRLGTSYEMEIENLRKHTLVVGTTGSGKTNTLFYLLREAGRHKIPFLVIEPVKTEYRKLLLSKELGDNLNVFTLGNNTISPFRMNPFEILPGVPAQMHMDLLKSVFNASFYMWSPLPHILEQCIYEIYEDKGWDFARDSNPRGIRGNAYPTLTDLYNKVEEIVDSLGYSKESTMELKSALKTRINSLRIGGKGLMLDTRISIPFSVLMDTSTIIELEHIGDDEEKSFMMGLLLTFMYEHYLSKGVSEGKKLGHITVIEEAHRLLANYTAENPYTANTRGKAVETFSNILSEIRAYGEGFIVAEQIPTKLASDLIKNTNLKIMHRVVAEDDRRIMGAAMNITEQETKKVTAFEKGEAAVFSEGDNGAYHVQVPRSKIETPDTGRAEDDAMVKEAMQEFKKNAKQFAPYESCLKFCAAICRYKDMGSAVASDYRFYSQLPSLVLLLIDNSEALDSILLQMMEIGGERDETAGDPRGIRICAAVQAAERYIEWLGGRYFWSFEDVERIKGSFLDVYIGALDTYLKDKARFSSEQLDNERVARFQEMYGSLCENKQPTLFCKDICPDNRCLYRFSCQEQLRDSFYHKRFVGIINEDSDELYGELGKLCRQVSEESILPGGTEDTIKKIALCYAMQKSHSFNDLKRRDIKLIMENLIDIFQ